VTTQRTGSVVVVLRASGDELQSLVLLLLLLQVFGLFWDEVV
jgi:hypothetical protein